MRKNKKEGMGYVLTSGEVWGCKGGNRDKRTKRMFSKVLNKTREAALEKLEAY